MKGDIGTAMGVIYLERTSFKKLEALAPRVRQAGPDPNVRALHAQKQKRKITLVNRATSSAPQDRWFTLVELANGKRLKVAAMSFEEAKRRNASVGDCGFRWVLGGAGF